MKPLSLADIVREWAKASGCTEQEALQRAGIAQPSLSVADLQQARGTLPSRPDGEGSEEEGP